MKCELDTRDRNIDDRAGAHRKLFLHANPSSCGGLSTQRFSIFAIRLGYTKPERHETLDRSLFWNVCEGITAPGRALRQLRRRSLNPGSNLAVYGRLVLTTMCTAIVCALHHFLGISFPFNRDHLDAHRDGLLT